MQIPLYILAVLISIVLIGGFWPGRSRGALAAGEMDSAGGIIRAIVGLPVYLLGPIAVFLRHVADPTTPARPLVGDDALEMPPDLQTTLTNAESALQQLGFGASVRMISHAHRNVTSYGALLEHSDGCTIASVMAARTKQGITVTAILFRSELADGTPVMTTNVRSKPLFPDRPGHDVMSFPGVLDPARLLALHRFRVRDRVGGAAPRPITRAPDPIAYQVREANETYAFMIATGYFRRTRTGRLRPTLMGATCMVWRSKFPWAQIIARRRGRAREAVLARCRP